MMPPLVLLVDDIPDHARLYEAMLRQEGYRVHLIHTGAAALAQAHAERPDCIVIDVRLPDIDGWELCRQLKADGALADVPVVILTSDVSASVAEQGAASGCSAWLAHPTFAHDVPRVVGGVLAQGRPAPACGKEAVLGVANCHACGSGRIRATLRLGAIQYFSCLDCRRSWRIEHAESVA